MILLATTLFCLLTHLWISYSNSSILRPLPRSKASITLAKRPVGSLLASSRSLGKYVQFRTVWQGVAGSCWLGKISWKDSASPKKTLALLLGTSRFHQSPIVSVNRDCPKPLKTIHQSVEEYTFFPSDQQLPGDHWPVSRPDSFTF